MSQVNFYGKNGFKDEWSGDESEDNDAFVYRDSEDNLIKLPHSCGEWIIGDSKKTKKLIEDLKKLL